MVQLHNEYNTGKKMNAIIEMHEASKDMSKLFRDLLHIPVFIGYVCWMITFIFYKVGKSITKITQRIAGK